ncbi:DinI-like family protein [Atlantibacter hermannii]|uniref:DinI-like family protein n=1 Tax=Atlantibacter hermannii TaxID=565 RepID=UPI0028B14D9B|nr:DinI-like family protein [Atlantibacter hermannii]
MKVEVTIERTKKLPDGALPALENELSKRLNKRFEGCKLTVRRASNDGLSVIGGDKDEIANILQETWESADEWFY